MGVDGKISRVSDGKIWRFTGGKIKREKGFPGSCDGCACCINYSDICSGSHPFSVTVTTSGYVSQSCYDSCAFQYHATPGDMNGTYDLPYVSTTGSAHFYQLRYEDSSCLLGNWYDALCSDPIETGGFTRKHVRNLRLWLYDASPAAIIFKYDIDLTSSTDINDIFASTDSYYYDCSAHDLCSNMIYLENPCINDSSAATSCYNHGIFATAGTVAFTYNC